MVWRLDFWFCIVMRLYKEIVQNVEFGANYFIVREVIKFPDPPPPPKTWDPILIFFQDKL